MDHVVPRSLPRIPQRPTRPELARQLIASLAILLLAGASAPSSVARDLSRTRDTVQAAFGAGSASRLRPLLPPAGRIFLSLPSLDSRRGYVSPDQCFYLLDELFGRFPVQSFSLAAADTGKHSENRHRARGRLVVRLREGTTRTLDIHFLLSHEEGVWRLREIRES